jgi:VWFA-related protein
MKLIANGFWSAAPWVALAATLSAQVPESPGTSPQKPTFKVQVELITTDLIVRDAQQQFVPDLVKGDFDVYEDGVKQDIASLTLVHGGRVRNVLAPPPPPAPEGIILPAAQPRNDVSGRVLLFFIDDLHLDFQSTPRVRQMFQRMTKTLLHEGDLFGVVSSGTSAIAMDLSYDLTRMDEVVKQIRGGGLKPIDIINGPSGAEGPSEVRFRMHTALSTVADVLQSLEQVHDRRKALIFVSDGYDLNPFQDARLGLMQHDTTYAQNQQANLRNLTEDDQGNPVTKDSQESVRQQQNVRCRTGE